MERAGPASDTPAEARRPRSAQERTIAADDGDPAGWERTEWTDKLEHKLGVDPDLKRFGLEPRAIRQFSLLCAASVPEHEQKALFRTDVNWKPALTGYLQAKEEASKISGDKGAIDDVTDFDWSYTTLAAGKSKPEFGPLLLVAPATGSIEVTRVFVDGMPITLTRPIRVKAGEAPTLIVPAKDGSISASLVIHGVTYGVSWNWVAGKLPDPLGAGPWAWVPVSSTPEGAAIYYDDSEGKQPRVRHRDATNRVISMKPGKYHVWVEKDGNAPHDFGVKNFAGGWNESLTCDLPERKQPTGDTRRGP